MNYLKKKFSVAAPGTEEYRDGWEVTFGHELHYSFGYKEFYCHLCGAQSPQEGESCPKKK